jgi:virginiamycin B lyase
MIVGGPDGNIWFAEGPKIGRMTPSGTLTEFTVPTANAGAWGITVGPDGNLWFTENATNKIGASPPPACSTNTVRRRPTRTRSRSRRRRTENLWFIEGGNQHHRPLHDVRADHGVRGAVGVRLRAWDHRRS